MDKLREFGRKAIFYVRVLSGYEERRIRSQRLKLQQRIAEAEAQKAIVRKIPEQVILSQVRRMVEEMKALNKSLEDAEAAIDNHFKPLDKQAEILMKVQLEGEEKTMKEMVKTMQKQALLEKVEAEQIAISQIANAQIAKAQTANANQQNQEKSSAAPTSDQVR